MRYAVLLLGLLLCYGVSSAGEESPQRVINAEGVTVTTVRPLVRAALTSTVVDSAAVAESVNLSFAELLTKHSPLFVKSYGLGSLATVSFRGTAASHTTVEWNGLAINNPMLGQVDFSMIPVWMVDRTELLHGGSSLHSGGGALGGSVLIGSQPQWGQRIYGSAMQGVGSYGNYQTMASVGGGTSSWQLRARYIYQQARNDFEFLNTAVPPFDYQRQSNANYRKHTAVVDAYLSAGRGHMLSLHGWFHTANRNLPTIMSYEGKGREEWQSDDELRTVLKWSFRTERLRSELTAGYSTTDLDYFLANQTDMGEVINYDSRSAAHSLRGKYLLEWQAGPSTMLRGLLTAEHNSVGTLDHRTDEGYTARRTDLGLSLSAHQRMGRWLSGYALLRVENNGALMPSLGLEAEPIGGLTVKLNAARNYHRPTLNDLYWLPGGNADLRPERGYTADLALGYSRGEWLTVGLTGYMSLIDDWIMWRPSEYRYWTAENVAQVFARGVEFNFRLSHTLGGVRLALGGNYAFTRTTSQKQSLPDDLSPGKQLIYIPEHKANVMVDGDYRGFYLNYTWSFVSERFTSSGNAATRHTLPAYGMHGVLVGKRYRGFDLQVKVDNLFNKDYQAILWRPMPRRNYTVLLRYSF